MRKSRTIKTLFVTLLLLISLVLQSYLPILAQAADASLPETPEEESALEAETPLTDDLHQYGAEADPSTSGLTRAGTRAGDPTVEYAGPLEIKRSEVANRTFMDHDKWNLNEAWAAFGDYPLWQKSGIVAMLSKVTINDQSIEPQSGDNWAWTRMYNAMGGSGTTSFTNKLSKVAVLCQKARSVPANLPLSAYEQLTTENTYTAPFIFKTDYSVDYSSYTPLFKNDFILIDDYRQVTFEFAPSADEETHGRFTDPIELLSLGGYQNVEKPNNAVGLVQGQSMNDAGLSIPNYELDEGWEIKEISDGTNVYTEDEILNKKVDENITYTIKLHQPRIKVVVPAIWYPVDKDTGGVISGLNSIPTYPDMYPRSEIAILNEDTDVYEINLAAIPEPLPGSYTENNFNLTASILFTDRFHRVSAQGYNTFAIKDVSSVVKVEYGDVVFEDVANGIQGVTRTPYQEDETMHMYLAVRTGATLSEATYKESDVSITNRMTAEEIRNALLGHIESVNYYDLDQLKFLDLDVSSLDKLFLFRYEGGEDGAFIKDTDTGEYINYMNVGFDELPDGKYEAVFPIYWQYDIPARFGAADEYIRNRYKLDDTFHFSFTKITLMDVEGKKTWDDANDQDGKRPDAITINLYKKVGVAEPVLVESLEVTPDADDNWAWTFTDLPKYEGGVEIVYSVSEDEVEGYTATIEGYDVTNTHTPETVEVSGLKTWSDNDDKKGIRPESIMIRLLADGVEVDTKTVTSAEGWAWSFTDLAKYRDGGVEIVYSITEDTVLGYSSSVTGYDVTNTYSPLKLTIEGTKVLTGRKLSSGEFSFAIANASDPEHFISTATNNADGSFAFEIELNKVGTYKFVVKEVPGSAEHVTYDKTVFTVNVVVSENPEGVLDAEMTLEEEKISFHNCYDPPTLPSTGSEGDNLFLAGGLVLIALGVLVLFRKQKNKS